MAGAKLIARSRGIFDAPRKEIAMATPVAVQRGDLLIVLVSHDAAEIRGTTPDGWVVTATLGAGGDVLDVYVRMVGDDQPTLTAFPYRTASHELLGELVAIRGSAPGVFLEATATTAFAATTVLATAGVVSQQAINLIVAVWTCADAPALALPEGFTPIDSYSSALASPRSLLVGFRGAGATGALSFPAASASVDTTGRGFTLVIRDRLPITPGELVDLVPGNIGLIGRDARPAR